MAMKYKNVTMGTVEAVFNKLGGEEGVKRFLCGELKLVVKKHLIDCDADPFVPEGWEVEEHRKGGKLEWDPGKVELYLCDEQEQGIKGHTLRKRLECRPVLNAYVIDFLLEYPEIIPEGWKGPNIFFLGTIYCRRGGRRLAARFLVWDVDRWSSRFHWLDYNWYNDCRVALCK